MPSRNWAAKTRVNYRNDIADLLRFLEGRSKTDPNRVDLQDLEAYMAELDRRGYTGTTRRRKTSSIKSFFGFLKQYGYITNNVAEGLIPPAREYKEPRVLTTKEYQALLRACSHDIRDAAIIELLLQTGIRLSELARLTLDDVDLPKRVSRDPTDTGTLFVYGKGRKERTISLNYKACKALKAWLKIRPNVDSSSLFVSKFLEPMSPRAYEYVVKKYLKEAGIKRASVHTLRHTFATHHVAKGTSLRTVQEALGHADLKTTSIYVQLAREAMNKELQEHAL
jgi:site-specific recombinase XerD